MFAWFIASDAKGMTCHTFIPLIRLLKFHSVEFYLGGSVGFNSLVDAPSMRRLLDTGRVSVYITQDVALDINQSLSTIANLWTSGMGDAVRRDRPHTYNNKGTSYSFLFVADPGQTAFTFGVDNNTIGSYASMFHHSSWFPNVVSIDGPWQSNNYADLSTPLTLLPTISLLTVTLICVDRTNWSAYVNTIRTTGMSIVMPIYVLTPAENANNSLLNIYSWTHNPYPLFISFQFSFPFHQIFMTLLYILEFPAQRCPLWRRPCYSTVLLELCAFRICRIRVQSC